MLDGNLTMYVTKRNGQKEPVDLAKIERCCIWAAANLSFDYRKVYNPKTLPLYDGIETSEIQEKLAALAATIDHPDASSFAARLLLQKLYKHANNGAVKYMHLRDYITMMVEQEVLEPKLLEHFNLDKLNSVIRPERDFDHSYMSLVTLSDRYMCRDKNEIIREMPQHFYMRVAMGLALAEKKKVATDWAIRFYNIMSTRRYSPSTPTLFNSGTLHPQLSSCFLLEIGDSTDQIFETLHETATYSKFAGGVAVSMTPIRSKGSFIKSTRGKAGGIVPYAKLFNDTMLGFDQSGKRLGSCALYLETWHDDIENFLELVKVSGDERTRAHDIFTANWIPDLFLKRVKAKQDWSLFSPSDVPDLIDAYGEEFERKYVEYEQAGLARRKVKAKKLWQKILGALFNDNGLGWPCFKDECNRRSMTRGYGRVHSSNLCTEITLRTSRNDGVSAVCNLGSVNLAQNKTWEEIEEATKLGVRMIDNAVQIGFLPHKNGRDYNKEDRPLGLGIMGYTQWLVEQGIDFESQEHLEAADELLEFISYHAILTSHELSKEKGSFPTFEQSQWALGELPIDTANEKAKALTKRENAMDWESLREKTRTGMRNSQLMAIAPTATIANIADCTNSIELPFKKRYTKGNLSGDFFVTSPLFLQTQGTPYEHLAKTAGQVDQLWVVKAAAVRQKWIDQAQSNNVWLRNSEAHDRPLGDILSDIYMEGWELGLKTFYYLRTESVVIKNADINNSESPAAQPEVVEGAVCNMEEGCVVCQ